MFVSYLLESGIQKYDLSYPRENLIIEEIRNK